MSPSIKRSLPTQLVLALLIDQQGQELFGGDITKTTKVRSGTLYPMLQRLEGISWVQSRWEDADDALRARRPRRRYYRLTGLGEREARSYCASAPAGMFDVIRRALQRPVTGTSS